MQAWPYSTSQVPAASPSYWLGATDAAQEGSWLWQDGTSFAYTNWAAGGLIMSSANSCLEGALGSSAWLDASCTKQVQPLRLLQAARWERFAQGNNQ